MRNLRAEARQRFVVWFRSWVLDLGRCTWTYDPGMTLDHDVSDTKGNLIAKAGQRVNPLDLVTVRQAMVFIDGDVPEQVEWALGKEH